jgi:hypothetical protein
LLAFGSARLIQALHPEPAAEPEHASLSAGRQPASGFGLEAIGFSTEDFGSDFSRIERDFGVICGPELSPCIEA